MTSVRLGLEVFFEDKLDLVKDKNVGIITNQTGILPDFTLNVDYIKLKLDSQLKLKAIFAPEQGFRGNEQAGFSSGGYVDPQSQVMVYSLYEKTPSEINQIFDEAGIDTIIYDIQDVGARFYTYIWTMADTLEAIADTDKRLIVLDRPNPLGGLEVDGPVVKEGYESFVGRYRIPIIHGMTTGELAYMFNDKFVKKKQHHPSNLEIVWMEGWSREMLYDDTKLPFVFPSVNLPTLTSVVVYPGQGLFEGLNISEGRGTTHPFEIVGAPFIDFQLAKTLNRKISPGTHYMESHFTPTFKKFTNETCAGVQVYITDRSKYNSLRTALDIMTTCRDMYPGKLKFGSTFDVLTGSSFVRESLDSGLFTEDIINGWKNELDAFKLLRTSYLHY